MVRIDLQASEYSTSRNACMNNTSMNLNMMILLLGLASSEPMM